MSETVRADVCVIGAGIVGLHNALQYARRGFSVVIVDELTERGTSAYKVGESLLIFSNAFLRTIGELDKELSESFEKRGVWFAHGLEGKTAFGAGVSEWGFQHAIPERWKDAFTDKKFQRTMFGDCQIVRPEIEAVLRDRLKQFDNITLIDRGLVRDLQLGSTLGVDCDHVVTWRAKDGSLDGTVRARWLIDCSGRARLLVKRFGHDVPSPTGSTVRRSGGSSPDAPTISSTSGGTSSSPTAMSCGVTWTPFTCGATATGSGSSGSRTTGSAWESACTRPGPTWTATCVRRSGRSSAATRCSTGSSRRTPWTSRPTATSSTSATPTSRRSGT
ncbi:FAD-dependent oxidoreductase [Phytohabitans flavus]|uniref:FAD-dependent oxidoreductase n=1 Tax=Phytohabitans flavus TaxID=1076124 RepID=UPI001564ED08